MHSWPLSILRRNSVHVLPSGTKCSASRSAAGAPPAPAAEHPKKPRHPMKQRPRKPSKAAPFQRNLRKTHISLLTSRLISYIMLTIKLGCFRPSFSHPRPQSGWLFPPSSYCPHDCECCPLPCKLSRYHVGPHTCGKRHSFKLNRFSTVSKLSSHGLALSIFFNFVRGRVAPLFRLSPIPESTHRGCAHA